MPSEQELRDKIARQNKAALPVQDNTIIVDEKNIEFSFTDFSSKVNLHFCYSK